MPKSDICLVNETGGVIGHAPRAAIRPQDIYHGIFVLLITPDRQLVLSKLGGGRFTATAVSLRAAAEDVDAAALRAAHIALPTVTALHHLGDQFVSQERPIYISAYYGIADADSAANPTYQLVTAAGMEDKLAACTRVMQTLWATYKHLLPM